MRKIRKVLLNPKFLALVPMLVFLNIVSSYPFIYGAYLAMSDVHIVYSERKAFFGGAPFIGLNNFVEALKSYAAYPALEFSLLFTFFAVGVEFLVGMGLALLANREIRGKTLIRSLLLLPMMTAPIVVGGIWKMMFWPDTGLINYILRTTGIISKPIYWFNESLTARFAVILVDIWEYTPFLFLIFLSGLSTLPRDPYEAAMLDGASPWQVFRHITLPMLKPIILVGLVFRIMGAFGSYDIIFSLTRGRPGFSTYPFTFHIYWTSFQLFNLGQGAALGWISLVITLIISIFFIRALRKV